MMAAILFLHVISLFDLSFYDHRSSQVVGWPPIRAYRMNSLVNQAKLSLTEEFSSLVEDQKSKNVVTKKANNSCNKHNTDAKEKVPIKTNLFVKVNMDGIPIGRKVDLNAHSSYETLAQTLEEMFFKRTSTVTTGRESIFTLIVFFILI